MNQVLDKLNQRINAANKHREVVNEYKTLQTDEERIIFTLKVMLTYDIIPKMCGDTKDAKESEKLREQGNKVFVSKTLTNVTIIDALKLYTKSIAYAPYPSEQLALSYANRSAVLLKLHKYKECIQDIDRAIMLMYPDNLRAKLYMRKIECLQALKPPNVEDAVKEAQQCYNTEIPCASDAVSLKYNEQYGRHIMAARNINPGEVIAIETPYSLILNPNNVHTHCSNCLEVCWNNIPCNYCTFTMYCSEECRASEWKKYHDIECSVFPHLLKMDFSKLDLFSLRIAVQAVRDSSIHDLREEVKDVDSHDDIRTKGFSKDGIFASDQYRSILSLVTNTDKRSVHDLFRRSMDSCFILYFVTTCTSMFGSPLEKDLSVLMQNTDVTFVGSLILRHQQTIPSNAHSFPEEYDMDTNERGIVAMPFFSLINHSCNPNVLRVSRPKDIVIYAMYPIQECEQIFDNYSYHYALSPKATRRKALFEQYYFICNCIPCQDDWPLFQDVQSFQSLVQDAKVAAMIASVLMKSNNYLTTAAKGNVLDMDHIVDDLLQMIKVLYNLVPMPCLEMNTLVEILKRVYALHGNIFEIPKM
ncbi:SET and MYND domain-containing protein 4 [Dufourea novaeangliae]|uniref:Protein-lysine N-methyltransferase SMYD4 n=1 Tax=Dufourea novaeangliae TaxID=178035 RepID=A0A154P1E3_DUFNO|nr:SET and MYND domain-containing protein 4 [Dufourea novaeangliae]